MLNSLPPHCSPFTFINDVRLCLVKAAWLFLSVSLQNAQVLLLDSQTQPQALDCTPNTGLPTRRCEFLALCSTYKLCLHSLCSEQHGRKPISLVNSLSVRTIRSLGILPMQILLGLVDHSCPQTSFPGIGFLWRCWPVHIFIVTTFFVVTYPNKPTIPQLTPILQPLPQPQAFP
jgi:hypothetical protein